MTTTTPHAIRTLNLDLDERPFLVIWEVTRACELVCAHCRADAQHERDPLELSTAEGFALLDDLAAYGAPRPMVVLTGGDPFERPDLEDLVAHGTSIGLHVSLSPSVTPLLTAERLAGLRRVGASAVSLSLDGATAATHDGFRGVSGVFDRTLEAARIVQYAGLRLQVNTTVTADNVHELPRVLDIVTDMQAGLWSVFFLVPTGRGVSLNMLPATDVEDVLHWLHEVGDRIAIKATEAPHYRRVALQRAAAADPDRAFPPGPLRLALRSATTPWVPTTDGATDRPTVGAPGGPVPGSPGRPSTGAPERPSDDRRPASRPKRPPLDINAGRGFAFVDHHGFAYPSGFLPMPAGTVRSAPFSRIYRESILFRSLRDPERLEGRCGHCEFRDVCGGSRSRAFAVTGSPYAEDPSCAYQPGN